MVATDDTADELKARAERWRASVRAQAAHLADWESPPLLPDRVPITAGALKLLMQDAGRILGAVVCMHADDETAKHEGDSSLGQSASERAARDQQTIASLQAQLAEARAQIHAQHGQLNAASATKSKPRRRGGGSSSLIVPHGAISLELPEPL